MNIINVLIEKYKYLESEISGGKKPNVTTTRKADHLARLIFSKMSQLLDEQIYKKKNGEVVSPPFVTIFFSTIDEEDWRGAKRQALIEDLETLYVEKIKQISEGALSSAPIPIQIDLKVELGLKKGEIAAEHSWEEEPKETEVETITLVRAQEHTEIVDSNKNIEDIEKTLPVTSISDKKFTIEIWLDKKKQVGRKFFQGKISIGRTSESKGSVDLHLADDPRIARIHATLEMDKDGFFWLTAVGNNPTKVGGLVIPQNKTVQVQDGQDIEILNFILKPEKEN